MPFTEYEIWDGNRYRYTCHQTRENWSPFDEIDKDNSNPRVVAVCQGVRTEIFC